jgi:hypothetical protein
LKKQIQDLERQSYEEERIYGGRQARSDWSEKLIC